jgi:predicted NACHT family NTPase
MKELEKTLARILKTANRNLTQTGAEKLARNYVADVLQAVAKDVKEAAATAETEKSGLTELEEAFFDLLTAANLFQNPTEDIIGLARDCATDFRNIVLSEPRPAAETQ